ncbi:uncharacterized protein LOC128868027 [Anastrepha ludens]|uniref:uncharacterized protein LOC128868027 n=1 Tax=Anastrepha ludens TaxID=28586 RepID=UPI0023AFDDEE|nr:uncharacterized protein LOC128868027 [Anastrepha ludens]
MQQIGLPKWFFCCSTIVLQIYVLHASELQNQEAIEKVTMDTIDWPGLLTNLRDSWQSPLSYLQKRGYLPPGNEKLLAQKLSELRGMSANELRNDENLKVETNGDAYASPGSRANARLHPSDLSSAETDMQSSDGVIATYGGQQPQEAIDNFLKEFSLDAQPDSDTETDLEFDEDVESFKSNKANACGEKPHTGGVKSNSKHKCKLKSKSKTKSQPGFFKRIKQKLSSIFTSSKNVDSKTDAIKKPCLTPDYANYFVKYLANKDVKGQYAGIKKYGEKGVHRRDQSGEDLSKQDLTSQSTNLKDDTAHVKDFSLNSFPFNDFNLGDLNLKKVLTKGTRSQSNDNKLSDLKNFNSQDEELNKIVHSLAEPQSPAKDLPDTKIEKWEPKEDFNLKEFSFTKDAQNKLHDNSNSLQKEFAPNFEGKNVDNAEKNGEPASAVNDLTLPHTKNSDISIEDNWSKGANLNDFDFSLPALNLKNLTSPATDTAAKDAGVKDFGNLGMSSIKMKILESLAEEAAANADIEHISHQPLKYGFDAKSTYSDAKDELTNEGNSNDYGARLLDTYKMNAKSLNGDANHQAGAKEVDVKNFDFGSLTANNRNYLDLDRQFTRQVVENIIRKERKGYGHNDRPNKE